LIFFLMGRTSSLLYWASFGLSLPAIGLGWMARDQPLSKSGLGLGILGALVGIEMFFWLNSGV
jgi:hypothetical protein